MSGDRHARIIIDEHGYEAVLLEHPRGGHAEIMLHGAHLTSCVTIDGTELIYMSKDAVWENSAALRGGVPVCFPQFSDMGPCTKSHGFARNSKFELATGAEDPRHLNQGECTCRLVLNSSAATLAEYPFPFQLFMNFRLLPHGVQIDMEVHCRPV